MLLSSAATSAWAQTFPKLPVLQTTNPEHSVTYPVIQPKEEAQPANKAPEIQIAPPVEEEPKWGPVMPEDTKILFSYLPRLEGSRMRVFGWLNMGYTYSSTGSGPLNVEPRENKFGNEFTVNQAAIVLERTLKPDQLSFGFRMEFYSGARAAIQPGGIVRPNPRMVTTSGSCTFRHCDLDRRRVDLKVGRQWT